MFPFILFYGCVWLLMNKTTVQKRDQALKSSFVKIKGNDVVATTKIFYSLIYVPVVFVIYMIVFSLVALIKYKKGFFATIRLTFICSFIIPVYLYVGVAFYYDFKRYLTYMWNQFRLRVWNKKTGMDNFKGLVKEKLQLEDEMMKVIVEYKDELKESIGNMIAKRDLNETYGEEKIEKILEEIGNIN